MSGILYRIACEQLIDRCACQCFATKSIFKFRVDKYVCLLTFSDHIPFDISIWNDNFSPRPSIEQSTSSNQQTKKDDKSNHENPVSIRAICIGNGYWPFGVSCNECKLSSDGIPVQPIISFIYHTPTARSPADAGRWRRHRNDRTHVQGNKSNGRQWRPIEPSGHWRH